ncbi:MAG: cobyric acid synthase [Bacteroidales bacterium]|nr:cobyric acid synthase [Bacteroidales bacterium]
MKPRLHPVMLAGTGSDVGKSVLATAFCRIFLQDGYAPAPFKAQNMALNSYATPDGLEIGRAQAVQAEAAGVPCHTDMNPLLLKPQSDHTSQVVLNGRPIGNQDAYDYFRKEGREPLRAAVNAAYDRLAVRFNPIVMEGAGSLAEINLRDSDLVNIPMARHAGADILLVGDIDRGGVFASVYGSLMLLPPEDRALVKGIIINKFRGDLRLFEEGRRMLKERCGIPVLGVVPYFDDIHIEAEDSVALSGKSFHAEQGKVNLAVVLLRHISNFTDFDALERDERIHLYYTDNVDELSRADIILIPGSKSTIDDLLTLRRSGVAEAILHAARRGATVLGICGGYQMMGSLVSDPDHVEGPAESVPGLGLLPVETALTFEKVTRQVCFTLTSGSPELAGYEIHMGRTALLPGAKATVLNRLADGAEDGFRVGNCLGTYIHGILDNPSFIDYLLQPFADRLSANAPSEDPRVFKERQYDLLAAHVRKYVDIPAIYRILTEERK